jgi:AraC-like DNA-binding protein
MERRTATWPSTVAWYREFEPHPALQGRVRALFSFTSTSDAEPSPSRRITFQLAWAVREPCFAPSFADGSSSIVFDLGTVLRPTGIWCDSAAMLGGKVIGPMRRASAVAPNFRRELPAMVGAYLHPAQLSAFARLPSCEVTDRILPIEEVWGSQGLELSERLAMLNESRRIDLFENALLRQMTAPRERGSAVDVAGLANCVFRRGGRVSIESLAATAGVSRQQLTRVFRERVGVSPKLYCRLARFLSVLGYTRAGDRVDWARAAYELGYADQSHMIAECREFSSLTPHMLASGRWFHPFMERAKAPSALRRTVSS